MKKKILAIIVLFFVLVAYFLPGKNSAPLPVAVPVDSLTEPASNIVKPQLANSEIQDRKKKDLSQHKRSNKSFAPGFVMLDPQFPEQYVAIPVNFFQDNYFSILDRLVRTQNIGIAFNRLVGHGYVNFKISQIEKLYPNFIPELFTKFASNFKPEFFWREIAGNAKVKFHKDSWSDQARAGLNFLTTTGRVINFVDTETLVLDLNFAGKDLTLVESIKLNEFFLKNAQEINQASISAEGDLALMFNSLIVFADNLSLMVQTLSAQNQLQSFLQALDFGGLMLLHVPTLRFYQQEFSTLYDLNKILAAGILLQELNGQFSSEIDPNKVQPLKKSDPKVSPVDIDKIYKSNLTFPMPVKGSNLFKFSRGIYQIMEHFQEQTFFPVGTEIKSELEIKTQDLGENIENTFIDVLKQFGADQHFIPTLKSLIGDNNLFLPIQIRSDRLEHLPRTVDLVYEFIARQSPKPDCKVYLELSPKFSRPDLLTAEPFNILEIEDFNNTKNVVLNLKETKKVELFKQLATVLDPSDFQVKGYLQVDTQLILSERFLFELIKQQYRIGEFDFAMLLRGLSGSGSIKVYPSTARLFDQELVSMVNLQFKNNQAAFERWKKLTANFTFSVPEKFQAEYDQQSVRGVYEYLNDTKSGKVKEFKISQLVRQLQLSTSTDLAVPQDLGQMLEILSDDRKISDVLKDKNEIE